MSVLAAFDDWLQGIEAEMFELPSGIASACLEATKEIRKDIIQSWYPYNWNSTDAATVYNQDIHSNENSNRGMSTVVITNSHIDSGLFYPVGETASVWIKKHGGSDPHGFILNLLMDEGIVGLPEVFAVSYNPPRKNPHFQQALIPLEAYFDTSPTWQTFEARVKAKI